MMPEDDRGLARVELRARDDRAQVVVDAVGIVLVQEPDLQQQLPRALMDALDRRRVGQLARRLRRAGAIAGSSS